ncbi:MAG: chemotaxis protein CheW, partial [Beijerinckiaceae bacterium]|nr:chemotaxis protein CheW [Beijerinckiaceae bacterium]
TPRGDGARSLRIDSARLDALLLTVGELMTIKNGFGELAAGARALQGGGELARAIAATQKQLDQVVGTLYGDVLQTRMVPVAQAFRRLPRVVHDLARRLDKPADLVIVGDDIGADKTIVDQLFEPMLHIVRNAMDHGVETPAERSACGKPAKAKLLLEVARQGEQIVLRFSDDGRGIDPASLRAAAVRRNVVSAEQASRLDDRAALELLFHAGFSTAAEVSDLSGRGVGLDVVRAEVNRLGGTVEIGSRIGRGTEVAMRLPLSFAMTQLLVLSVAGERYGVPLADVAETVRLNRKDILPVRENQAFLLRDRVVPLLSLVSLLGLPENREAAPDVTVLVLALGQGRVGVTVDAIAERVEMVTKPLEGLLSGAPGIAGTTVLGDGQVLLVLDMAELIQ